MQVNVSEAGAPAAHQERQLVAGRYRLTVLLGADERTEVWRALDEPAQTVVTLEFLRTHDAESRERFVTEARRIAAIEQPAAMRVAAIYDDGDETFVVFEHLVHGPVAREPGASDAADAAAASDSPSHPALRGLIVALRDRNLALIDAALLKEAALELVAMARSWLERMRSWLEEMRLETILAEARALRDRLPFSPLRAILARTATAARAALAARPRAGLPALPRMRFSMPKVSLPPRVRTPQAKPSRTAPAMPRALRIPRLLPRIRWGRVFRRGLSLGLVAAAIIVVPPEAAYLGNTLKSALDQGVRTVSETVERGVRAVTSPGPNLARATFEVPPLSAYRAAFEAQAAYPTATPNSTVEWVIALRNTGSAGWYRGIDGAQASLALSDGSTVAVQSTPYVGPGQVGWFVVHFPAPSEPGTHNVSLYPRIDGRGPLPDLGIYTMVTVSAKP